MEGRTVHLDFETRSAAPFGKSAGKKAVSAIQYAQHPSTEVIWASYAFNDEPVQQWRAYRGEPFPERLAQAVLDGWTIAAHNAGFEHLIWTYVLQDLHDLPPLPMEQMDCTAARAAIMALPRDLDGVTKAMGMEHQKDDVGYKLMLKMTKPRKPKKGTKTRAAEDPDGIYWHESEAEMERLGLYCDSDVEAERGLDKVLKPMSKYQRQQWLRVHRANMRGVVVDIDFVRKAKAVDECVQARYDQRLSELTHGQVTSVTALPAMKTWLEQQDVAVESLDKGGVIELLDNQELPAPIREVLEIRQTAGKSSVAKLDRFEILTLADRRMLENFLFHAANTGRLGGRGAQLQNLPSRGGLPWYWAEQCIQIILETPDPSWAATRIELLFGEIPTALSSCLRGIICAPKGKKLFVADFSNIEGRVGAWLGGEKWKLDGFRSYDTIIGFDAKGEPLRAGPDLYKVTAGMILGKSPEQVNKIERNVLGKVSDLALLFGGGVGAYESMAKIYQVNMADYWEIIRDSLDDQFVEKARWAYNKFGAAQAAGMGMTQEGWLAAETVKNAWRDRHPGIVKAWAKCEELSIKALNHPGKWFPWADNKCAIGAQLIGGKMFLVYKLPSGRKLYRADASLKAVKKFGRPATEIRFHGVDSTTRQWVRMSTYGGDTFQSCLGGGTMVLTKDGWTPITQITGEHAVWDGQEWVRSGGAVCNGTRQTIDLSGVHITPEHLVLTNDGWKEASSCSGSHRAASRSPVGGSLRGVGREEVAVARRLCVRGSEGSPRDGIHQSAQGGGNDVLRLPQGGDAVEEKHQARHVAPSGLRRLGQHACALLSQIVSVVPALWREGCQGMRTMARQFYELLGGHGAVVSTGAHVGAGGLPRELHARQLCVGDVGDAGSQQANIDPAAARVRAGDLSTHGDSEEHLVLSIGPRLVIRGAGDSTRPAEPVYDIINCGPRNRFVVRDGQGLPMIVHNCVQAIAYDMMDAGWENVEADGFDVVLSVHDEAGAEGGKDKTLEQFEAGMNRQRPWADGCPVSSAGYVADRYRKDG